MKLNEMMTPFGADIYYSNSFRNTLETHLEYFRKSSKTRTFEVPEDKADIFEGDLMGYLCDVGVEIYLHWLIMRMSGLKSPQDFGKSTLFLIVPDKMELERVRQAFSTSGKIRV